jgi:transposase-like protein
MKDHLISGNFQTSLEEILRNGARKMLQVAIENELQEFLDNFGSKSGVKRNGYLPEREIQTGLGPIPIKKPRVRGGVFTSNILPRYMRRTPSIEALIPALYLKGISTNSMGEALEAILGENAKGLSPTNIVRLKEEWSKEYNDWNRRSLKDKHYVYMWVDGIYCNVRLSDDRPCLLVIIGATPDGRKELVAIHDGIRESKLSWKTVLSDLKARGLEKSPELAIGDGALGFWAAIEEEFPSCKTQRCWVHKTANILDKMAKGVQADAKSLIHEMYMSSTKKEALHSFDRFLELYHAKYPKACECLAKDKERLFTFYDFPAIHWQHIRTTNPIESTFATIRHRAEQTKGCGSREAVLSMFYKLGKSAEKHWKKLRGSELISKVIEGVIFRDGEEVKKAA